MLRKLTLKNFRQHQDTTIEFAPGINTIVGLNNSGKSTIPEAIEFALYGAKALRDSAKGYITDGKKDGSASVELVLGDSSYVVYRDSSNATVFRDGELDAGYKNNVTAYVSTVTGVNHAGFGMGHYVRQKELNAFAELRPGKRHETIERMLRINSVDRAIKKIKEDLDEARVEQRGLLQGYRDPDAVQVELDDALTALEGTRGRMDQLPDLHVELEFLRTEVDKHKERVHLQKRLDEIETAEREARTLLENLVAVDAPDPALYAAAKELAVPLHEPEFVEEPVVPDSSALLNMRNEYKRLPSLGASCPTCLQAIPEEYRNGIEARRQELQVAIAEEGEKVAALMEQYKLASARRSAYVSAYAIYDAARRKRETLKAPPPGYDHEKLVALHARYVADKRELEVKQGIAAGRAELEARLAELVVSTHADEAAAELAALSGMAAECRAARESCIADIARLEGRIEELERQLDISVKTKAGLDRTALKCARLELEAETLTKFKRYLTAKVRPMFNEIAEALFHKVTKHRYANFTIGSDYDISFVTSGGYPRSLKTISGSENDLACLCMRLAIATLRSSKLAGPLGFVILDEISSSFDDERTRNTLDGLLELRDVIPQIINITHKPVEMRYADRLFTVKEQSGSAQISWID